MDLSRARGRQILGSIRITRRTDFQEPSIYNQQEVRWQRRGELPFVSFPKAKCILEEADVLHERVVEFESYGLLNSELKERKCERSKV